MVSEPGRPYFFYNRDEWGRHPHYGRFLELRENELVEMTWMTGNGSAEGTQGAETLLKVVTHLLLTPSHTRMSPSVLADTYSLPYGEY